jgi:hypothetical protein
MSSPPKVSLLNLALLLATTGLCLGMLLTTMDMPLEGGAIAVLGLGLVYLYLDRRLTPGLLIGPSVFLFLYHALGYSIGPLAQRYFLHSERFIEKGMILAQWGAVLGLATYAVVYHNVFRIVACRLGNGKDARRNASSAGSQWEGYAVLLLVVSGSLVLYGYVSGGSRRIGGSEASRLTYTLVSSFWYVQIIAFFFLGFLAVKRRGWWIALTAFAYGAYAGFQTLEGSRGPLLSSMLMLATGVVWAGYSVRKTLFALGVLALLLIPLAGIVDFYRSITTASQYEGGLRSRLSAFSKATHGLRAVEASGAQVANQAFIYAISAIVVDRVMVMTPSVIPHAGFQNLGALLYMYIPAVIAPNRPEIADGNLIAATYGIGYGRGKTHYYTPSVGEGYRRFGWVGIPMMYALSAIIFGVTVAICWAKRQKREWAAMLVFLVLQSPGVWSFTFNYAVYFALFYVPKYYIYFALLSKAQEVFTSCHDTLRNSVLVQRSRSMLCQGGSS